MGLFNAGVVFLLLLLPQWLDRRLDSAWKKHLGGRTGRKLGLVLSLGPGQTSQQLALADALQVQVSVVVLAAIDDYIAVGH